MKQFKSLVLCALMVVSLTLGGALAAAQFPEAGKVLPVVLKPMDDWPTAYGQL